MRSVKPRNRAPARNTRAAPGRRPATRGPDIRPEARGRTRFAASQRSAILVRILGGIRGTFPLRRPVLTLSLLLTAAGGALGIISGGHIGKSFAAAGNAVNGTEVRAGFAIRDVEVSGNEHTTRAVVDQALGFTKGSSLFAADPAVARARLMQLPWVSDAVVRRQFPDTVVVRLIERRPFAVWRNGNRVSVVERSGAIITAARAERFPRLPVLLGAGAPQAAADLLDALGAQRAVSARLRAAARIGERRWDLLLTGGVTVKLPEEGWKKQLADLERLIVDKGILERDIEIIDLRYPDDYVFRLHTGDSHPVPRDRHA
jgi:cell division protein FtsQ